MRTPHSPADQPGPPRWALCRTAARLCAPRRPRRRRAGRTACLSVPGLREPRAAGPVPDGARAWRERGSRRLGGRRGAPSRGGASRPEQGAVGASGSRCRPAGAAVSSGAGVDVQPRSVPKIQI